MKNFNFGLLIGLLVGIVLTAGVYEVTQNAIDTTVLSPYVTVDEMTADITSE